MGINRTYKLENVKDYHSEYDRKKLEIYSNNELIYKINYYYKFNMCELINKKLFKSDINELVTISTGCNQIHYFIY